MHAWTHRVAQDDNSKDQSLQLQTKKCQRLLGKQQRLKGKFLPAFQRSCGEIAQALPFPKFHPLSLSTHLNEIVLILHTQIWLGILLTPAYTHNLISYASFFTLQSHDIYLSMYLSAYLCIYLSIYLSSIIIIYLYLYLVYSVIILFLLICKT